MFVKKNNSLDLGDFSQSLCISDFLHELILNIE